MTPLQLKMHLYAINSWVRQPDVKVVIFTNELNDTIKKLYPPQVIFYNEHLQTGFHGNPLVRSWIVSSHKLTTTPFLAIVNSDIIIPDYWFDTTRRICSKFGIKTYIGIARVQITNFTDDIFQTDYNLIHEIFSNLPSNKHIGGDLFLFARDQTRFNISLIPDFEVGYCTWDNFMYGIFHRMKSSIGYNYEPSVYHLDHGKNKCNLKTLVRDLDLYNGFKLGGVYGQHKDLNMMLNYSGNYLYSTKNTSYRIYLD